MIRCWTTIKYIAVKAVPKKLAVAGLAHHPRRLHHAHHGAAAVKGKAIAIVTVTCAVTGAGATGAWWTSRSGQQGAAGDVYGTAQSGQTFYVYVSPGVACCLDIAGASPTDLGGRRSDLPPPATSEIYFNKPIESQAVPEPSSIAIIAIPIVATILLKRILP